MSTGGSEEAERKRATRIAVGLTVVGLCVLILLGWGVAAAAPGVMEWVDRVFSPGLGLKSAAIIAIVVSISVLILFAIFAGEGLIGEIQFMIPGFFLFFLFFWLMLAWVF